jgi:hypothetical protein
VHGVHRGVDGDAALLEGDVVVEDVGEREEALGRWLGAVGAEEVGGVGAEGGERGVEAVVDEVAVDEEGDLRGGDLLLGLGGGVRSGGLGRRHGQQLG